jgi:hypothetical protein
VHGAVNPAVIREVEICIEPILSIGQNVGAILDRDYPTLGVTVGWRRRLLRAVHKYTIKGDANRIARTGQNPLEKGRGCTRTLRVGPYVFWKV